MPKYLNNKWRIYIVITLLLFFCVSQLLNLYSFPQKINIVKGEDKDLDVTFPFTIKVLQDSSKVVNYNSIGKSNFALKKSYKFNSVELGNAKLQFNLFGLIPVKDIEVNVLDRIHLVPGGNSIGVRLNTRGVLVVSVTDITGVDGKKYNPARAGGIKAGDSIIDINGEKVRDAEHVVELLNSIEDKKIDIVIERNSMRFSTTVKPVKSLQDNCYRLGIWVRDKTAGIGTLTFYDDNSKVFGALGHGITDMDTGKLLNIENGKIMSAKVSAVEQGRKGNPGEIKGIFYETENVLGDIKYNTPYGIYGELRNSNIPKTKLKSIPIGLKEEVKEGKAYILTTINDNKIEKFEIEILKAQSQYYPEQKSMVIKITDKKLLEKTGGIVQGMSGSPIIQNGKLIGAVTHVFVNDPTKGYGIYIEWMLDQTNVRNRQQSKYADTK